jgi:hypothetical protein
VHARAGGVVQRGERTFVAVDDALHQAAQRVVVDEQAGSASRFGGERRRFGGDRFVAVARFGGLQHRIARYGRCQPRPVVAQRQRGHHVRLRKTGRTAGGIVVNRRVGRIQDSPSCGRHAAGSGMATTFRIRRAAATG